MGGSRRITFGTDLLKRWRCTEQLPRPTRYTSIAQLLFDVVMAHDDARIEKNRVGQRGASVTNIRKNSKAIAGAARQER